MQRAIVVFLICVGGPFMVGCTKPMYGLPHPHSELTAPTFCLYDAWADIYAKPVAIYRVRVTRANKIDDEPIDWSRWTVFSPISAGTDQVTHGKLSTRLMVSPSRSTLFLVSRMVKHLRDTSSISLLSR